jgi:hypothetical protein
MLGFRGLKPLQNLVPCWERWLAAGESFKKRQLAGKMPALPGSFAEVSACKSVFFNYI